MTEATPAAIPLLDPAGALDRLRALAEGLDSMEGLGALTERLYGRDSGDDWNRARVAADLRAVLGALKPTLKPGVTSADLPGPMPGPMANAAGKAQAESWGWWAGRDEEWLDFGGPFATRAEAIEAGKDHALDVPFYIVEAQPQRLAFSAEQLLNDQYFENDDWFDGDYVEPDRRGAADVADAELQSLLDNWVARWGATFIAPALFARTRNGEYITPAAQAEPTHPSPEAQAEA